MTNTIRAKQAPQILLSVGMSAFLSLQAIAQFGTAPNQVLGGTPAPRQQVRPNDLLWMRTVWRRVDLRQKMNQTMYFPVDPSQGRKSLYQFVLDGLLEEQMFTAYDVGVLGTDDMFTTPLSTAEVLRIVRKDDTVTSVNPISLQEERVVVPNWIDSEEIIAFDIKERWYIDAQQSVMKVGIVGIAPVAVVADPETGEYRGTKRLFWINYDEARFAMATWPVFVRSNDLQYMSYDDFFTQRRFNGTITKVSNVYDRAFVEYLEPEDALYQARQEHEKIRELELDMWNF
ncbi:MAG: gliding motility protein GldN [Cryomorphaceae bacterium]